VFAMPMRVSQYLDAVAGLGGCVRPGGQRVTFNNWSFLFDPSAAEHLTCDHAGEEMRPEGRGSLLQRTVARHLDGGKYHCTFGSLVSIQKWAILARNKYGEPVACVRGSGEGGGMVLLLPHLRDKPGFLQAMLKDVLP